MLRIPACILLTCICLLAGTFTVSAQEEGKTLSRIAADIEQYRDKETTMKLKLKYVDAIFEKIIFYDANNHDIVFDISDKKKRKMLRNQLLTIHEGMDYYVTFLVRGKGALDMIIADLVDFKPVIMSYIPE
ncbi:MAG: hypothetical protein CVV44_13085 [Spirochaetae bacterium HGW-Spirochaetae-1]|jgi:hypothetical protein|nr:MAG: hypothetical protein CVV44_13085 [Spirochaetae bacterium HGW-Spirochaetae-1]